MKISCGIVGLPNVGKSTLFNLITRNNINVANYPFCTIDPNVGVVEVPDERLDKLDEISKSGKKIPAVVEFYDIAGLVKGASSGEGLGNQFLAHIRDVSAIIHVVRCFHNAEIIHTEKTIDPIRDIDVINTELALKDLETIEKRSGKLETEMKRGDKQAKKDLEMLNKIKELLFNDKSIIEYQNEEIVRNLALLSAKPQLYLLNGETEDVSEELKTRVKNYIIADLSQDTGLGELIKKAYEILGLISFFTTGEDETRAWTIKDGSLAPQAAGVIHTDFENKFIRAEVLSYEDFIDSSGWTQAKQKGRLRTEGKEYLVKDGDILSILHS